MTTTIYRTDNDEQTWTSDGAPGVTIILGQGGILFVGDLIRDTNTAIQYRCTNTGTFNDIDTYNGCQFVQCLDDGNIRSVIDNSLGWQINTNRGYTDQSSLGFNASRQPSLTKDTQVSVSVTLANTLTTTSTVQFQISPDNDSFTTIATLENLTLSDNSQTFSANPIVPAGYYYQLVTSGDGSHTLVNLQELPL